MATTGDDTSRDRDREQAVRKWDGDPGDWIEWRFDVRNWSRRHDMSVPAAMEAAGCSETPLSLVTMKPEEQVLAGKVMTDLSLKTTGKAKRVLMGIPSEESDNGLEGWRLLTHLGEGVASAEQRRERNVCAPGSPG
jgi:hypothetical protein